MIRIRGLKKRLGAKQVLDGLDLDVETGETIVVMGRSGTGKSVLLKHVIGLMTPDAGSIEVDGVEVVGLPERELNELRKRFGMLFQGSALFDSKTVGENIAFPLREGTGLSEDEIQQTVTEALAMVGLHGIEGKMSSELSGGMRSRVGLARALVMKPEIMLYDEPTSALDPIMSDKINELILDFKNKLNMTSLVVTHDMATAYRIADKIAMLNEGKVIFFGTPAEIRASRNPYIQQFISGRRKLHYAVSAQPQEKEALNRTVDVGRLRRKDDIAAQLRSNRNPSVYDSLTGLFNLHSFRQKLAETFAGSRQAGTEFALALGDLDFFSEVNERYGMEFGNQVLQGVAAEVRNCIRGQSDVAARYKEDSFMIIIGSTAAKAVTETVERIRSTVAGGMFETADEEQVQVTLSFGIATSRPGDQSPEAIIVRAEQALSAAQQGGHNRVELYSGT